MIPRSHLELAIAKPEIPAPPSFFLSGTRGNKSLKAYAGEA